ncbi:MAG: mechanosensitive ion channel family protein [Rikenellaceae bacterium]|nr:mechanosensitive ion channel family protein [Rikenellaceae bacterium]
MSVEDFLYKIGVESESIHPILSALVTLIVAVLLGWLVYIIAKNWLSKIVFKVAGKTPTKWDDLMFDKKFFNRLALLLMPIVIRVGISGIRWEYFNFIPKLVAVWIIVASVLLVSAVFDGINRIYESYPVSKNKPIKVFIQVIMIFIYCVAIIGIVQTLTGADLNGLYAGLTAFAAVLMLIFKDSILGFVAGIQLTANNMVHIGDWIEMPGNHADGFVQEINLTTVKVQNWDKTITTVPTYKLVSEAFTNWKGMFESEGRRIKRSVYIDVNSIHYLSEKEIEGLKQSKFLNEYIEKKLKDIERYNAAHGTDIDKRNLTNIGTFREYLEAWINNNPDINHGMIHLVRQLQPGPTGLPVEIYCFSAKQSWVDYERIQADVFDHIFAVMPLFGLRTFQYPVNFIHNGMTAEQSSSKPLRETEFYPS